jgi:hypothetical protein
MCLRRAPEKYIAGAALDRADLYAFFVRRENIVYWGVRSIGLWRWYINITITILDIIHRPLFFKTHLNSTGLSVTHRKHITSPLRDQQANAIHRFVTMVY